jgi:hypothetical protein
LVNPKQKLFGSAESGPSLIISSFFALTPRRQDAKAQRSKGKVPVTGERAGEKGATRTCKLIENNYSGGMAKKSTAKLGDVITGSKPCPAGFCFWRRNWNK